MQLILIILFLLYLMWTNCSIDSIYVRLFESVDYYLHWFIQSGW